jgi:Protein of unknown function (DUF3179)
MRNKLVNWVLLIIIAITAFAMVAIPVYLIQPFAPQTENALTISYYLRSWSPYLTIIFLLLALFLSIQIWRNSKHWFTNIPLILPLILVGFSVWFAQQNHFLWMFNPSVNPAYAKISEVDFVKDDEMVMAVSINGEAVAYPVLQMAYHHVVQDVVGGQPITATY